MTSPRRRPARIDGAAGGLAVDLGLYAVSAIFAGVTAANATLLPHRAWGRVAVIGYTVAAVVVLAQAVTRRRWPNFAGTGARAMVTSMVFVATAVLPMLVEAVQRAGGRLDRAQEEVGVVESGGVRLWHTGTPYLSHDAIAALPPDQRLDAYLPYQPGMAIFGLPRAIFGVAWWTDARIWFAVTLVTALVLAARLVWTGSDRLIRGVQAATVLPICALTIATGGDDLPVLGICLLALALAARERYVAAGLAIGVAGALKLFAWPVAIVLLALVIARTRDRRTVLRYTLGAAGLPILVLIPAFLVNRDAAVENVIRFPIGRGLVSSPAASPFPGHLIAAGVPGGHTIATGLLVLAAIAIGWWLLRRPPTTAADAAAISAGGLLAAILLIPATRFGYLLYPIAYACWVPALRLGAGVKPPSRVAGRRSRAEVRAAGSRPPRDASARPADPVRRDDPDAASR